MPLIDQRIVEVIDGRQQLARARVHGVVRIKSPIRFNCKTRILMGGQNDGKREAQAV